MKIAIAAAGGNVGSRIAQNLSKTHAHIVLLGKSISPLEKLGIKNAQISITDISSAKEVLQVTKDVDALFWLVPPVLDSTTNQLTVDNILRLFLPKNSLILLVHCLKFGELL